jgi:hypothetical protein
MILARVVAGFGATESLMIGGENDETQKQIFADSAARQAAAAHAAAEDTASAKSAATWLFVALGIVVVGGAFLPRR